VCLAPIRGQTSSVLDHCKLTSAAAGVLAQVLGRNQGSTKVDFCYLDNVVLADGFRGNSRLKSLRPLLSRYHEVADQEVLAIAAALRDNKGLVDLNLSFCWMSDEKWNAICDSLKTHPTLKVLDLRVNFTNTTMARPLLTSSRIQALLKTLKVNMSIHTMRLLDRHREHELFRRSVIPYLATTRHRSHIRTIQETRPIAYRTNVLGRSLLAARTHPSHFWILLSGNAEVASQVLLLLPFR
jgi:hypothetical protein